MKKLMCFLLGCLLVPALCACTAPAVVEPPQKLPEAAESKLALDHYDSFSDDSAFVAAALDDIKSAGEKGEDEYNKIVKLYSMSSTVNEAVQAEFRNVVEDEAADCIRRIDAYNVLSMNDSGEPQDSGWDELLNEQIQLSDNIITESMNDNSEGERLKYYCVFWHHWDKERYGLPLTPYTTLSALMSIPRENIAGDAKDANRLIVCDVTYQKTMDYSFYGVGDSVTEGYSSDVRIYIQNCHTGETEEIGVLSYAPPASFETYAVPQYIFGEIVYSEINARIAEYFEGSR